MSGLPVLLFLDVSGGELLLILLVVFLVFGPEKMPEMARKAGRLLNQMKKASNDLTREFKKETSVLQNEIDTAHTKVKEQVESVNREFNRTKAQLVNDLKIETEPAIDPVKPDKEPVGKPDAEPDAEIKNSTEPQKPETDITKTE